MEEGRDFDVLKSCGRREALAALTRVLTCIRRSTPGFRAIFEAHITQFVQSFSSEADILVATSYAACLNAYCLELDEPHLCLFVCYVCDACRRNVQTKACVPLVELAVKLLGARHETESLALSCTILTLCANLSESKDGLLRFWGGALCEAILARVCNSTCPCGIEEICKNSAMNFDHPSSSFEFIVLWQWLRTLRMKNCSWLAREIMLHTAIEAGLNLQSCIPHAQDHRCLLFDSHPITLRRKIVREVILMVLETAHSRGVGPCDYGIISRALQETLNIEGAETQLNLLDLFVCEDDNLFLLLWHSLGCYQLLCQSNDARGTRHILHPAIMLYRFFELICFDCSLLLDWIVSPETIALQYILGILGFLTSNIREVEAYCNQRECDGGLDFDRCLLLFQSLRTRIASMEERALFPYYNPRPLTRKLDALDLVVNSKHLMMELPSLASMARDTKYSS